MMVKTWISITI